MGQQIEHVTAFSERNLEDELKAYELDSFGDEEMVENIDSD